MAGKRQETLPGILPPGIEEIDTAAQEYVSARDTRQGKTKLEVDAKQTLIKVMKKHERVTYSSKGLTVNLTEENKVTIKVTTSSADPNGDPEE